jgi:hypothetical protein
MITSTIQLAQASTNLAFQKSSSASVMKMQVNVQCKHGMIQKCKEKQTKAKTERKKREEKPNPNLTQSYP